MALPTSYLAYSDCFEALEKAFEDEIGGRIPVRNQEAAVHLRMRLNYARKLDREKNAELYDTDHPMYGRSQYDKLVARIREHRGKTYVYLLHRPSLEVEPITEDEEAEAAADEAAPPPPAQAERLVVRDVPPMMFKRRV